MNKNFFEAASIIIENLTIEELQKILSSRGMTVVSKSAEAKTDWEKLLPCPFCGTQPEDTRHYYDCVRIDNVCCKNTECIASFTSTKDVIWNTRWKGN